MNIEKKGKPIAVIKGGPLDTKLIYLDNNLDGKKNIMTENKFSPLPIVEKNNRECLYVTGPSGSGKSTYVSEYIKYFKQIFPDRRIIIFSKVEDDEALDKYNPIRITLDSELIEFPIKPEELRKSLVIFDDIDTIQDDKIKKAVFKIKDDLLQVGRHFKIYVIVTSHICRDHKNTRINLIESNSFTFFPSSGSIAGAKSVLKDYVGLDKKTIDKIVDMGKNSRWVTIYTRYPQYVMSEKEINLISNI